MKCPYCKSTNDRIIYTQAADALKAYIGHNVLRRRRYCYACQKSFWTVELPESIYRTLGRKSGAGKQGKASKTKRGSKATRD